MFHFPAAEGVSDTDGEADGVLVELALVEVEAVQDGEAGEILARLRLGGDRERLVGALGQTRQELEELYRRRCREDGQRSRVTTAAALCGAGLVIILLI